MYFRDLAWAALLALTLPSQPVFASAAASNGAQDAPLSIGLIADVQYCDAPADDTLFVKRYYRESIGKLEAAVRSLNRAHPDFNVSLGDAIDRDRESFPAVTRLLGSLNAPTHAVLGNHDFYQAVDEKFEPTETIPRAGVQDALGIGAAAPAYRSLVQRAWRFLFLDGTEISTYGNPEGSLEHATALAFLEPRSWFESVLYTCDLKVRAALNLNRSMAFNGAIGPTQFNWMRSELEQARLQGQRVILFNHFPVFPANFHNLWNAEEVKALLGRYKGTVAAYVAGHNHKGSYERDPLDGIHYVTLPGMVETRDKNAYGLMRLHADRLEIRGEGRLRGLIPEVLPL